MFMHELADKCTDTRNIRGEGLTVNLSRCMSNCIVSSSSNTVALSELLTPDLPDQHIR